MTREEAKRIFEKAVILARDTNVPRGGEPLTLEQLREKIDEPVYLYIYDTALNIGWHIIEAVTKDKIIFRGWDTVYVPISSIGKCFDLYAYPPARIGREKWEPCEWCGSIGEKPDNWVCTLEDDNGHTVTNNHMVVCAPVNYCPVCGRPLTPEAWEEMEKRLMLLPEPPKEG